MDATDDLTALTALRLQLEWGADEAMGTTPIDRLADPAAVRPVRLSVVPAAPSRPEIVRPEAPAADVAADSIAAWRAALTAFDGAGLAATATHVLLPGPLRADAAPTPLLVLAEAPGAEEDRSGEAFCGPSGRLLRSMLASLGLDGATAAYLTPWRPPGGRPASEAEWRACLPFLIRLVALTRPQAVLATGALPARALLGAAARRGRFLASDALGGIPVLVTANPQTLLAQPMQKAAAWAELRLLRRRIDVQMTVS